MEGPGERDRTDDPTSRPRSLKKCEPSTLLDPIHHDISAYYTTTYYIAHDVPIPALSIFRLFS